MINKKVSIIIPNWNGKGYLKSCLDSLRLQTFKDLEIIVVDNGSTDGSIEFLQDNYPEVRIIRFSENRGFSVAVNEGIKASKGDYIALLNNDTEADPKWLEELVYALERHPEVGFCASKMLNYHKREIIDTAGDGFSRYGIAFKRGSGKPDGPEYNKEEYVFGACGGAAIYRREVFEEVGLFDEDFFAYLEDVDMSFRAQLKGFKCLYVPKAVIYHRIGGTSGGKGYSLKRMAGKVANKLFVLIKDMPGGLILKNLPFIFFAFAIEGALLLSSLFISPRSFKREVLKLRLIPQMFKKRAKIHSGIDGRSVQYVSSLMDRGYPLNPLKGARWTKRFLFALLFILLAFLTSITFQKVEVLKEKVKREEKGLYIPSSQFLKPAILGYDSMVADLYWIKAVQYIGDRLWSERRYPQLYPLLDLVTDLDPKFEYAYEVGGIILSLYSERIDEGIALLKKADRQELGYWEIPFLLGFNYFYYLGEYETAARYIEKASKMPRSPAYLPRLAARLYTQAGNPETAIEFLSRVYETTKDENVKKGLEERIKEVMVERDIRYLERATNLYKERFGVYPESLDLLVSKGIIERLPEEPFGGYYYIDPKTREIKSSIKKERLKVYRQRLRGQGKGEKTLND